LTALKGDGTVARPNVLQKGVMMFGCEFGSQNHVANDVPVALFGQAGGYFKTGRLLTYGNELDAYYKHTGTLLAIGQAMGVTELSTVGNPAPRFQRGPNLDLRG